VGLEVESSLAGFRAPRLGSALQLPIVRATIVSITEHWLICGPPLYTSVARREDHLAWLHEHPQMSNWGLLVESAEERIAWLKGLGDPFPDHRAAAKG
jgi:hypothetical protein